MRSSDRSSGKAGTSTPSPMAAAYGDAAPVSNRGAQLHWIEDLFGVDPDGGSGLLEGCNRGVRLLIAAAVASRSRIRLELTRFR